MQQIQDVQQGDCMVQGGAQNDQRIVDGRTAAPRHVRRRRRRRGSGRGEITGKNVTMPPQTSPHSLTGSVQCLEAHLAAVQQQAPVQKHNWTTHKSPTMLKPINWVMQPVHAALKAEAAVQVRPGSSVSLTLLPWGPDS